MLHDFLNNHIIYDDMEEIYAAADWSVLKGKSFYISGATGMIASYFVMFLIYLNEVRSFDIQIYVGIRKIAKAQWRFGDYVDRKYFYVVEGDVVNDFPINKKINYIVHAASLASPQYYGGMPVETMLPNIVGAYRLLESARKYGTDGLLFFSSGAVYGKEDGENGIKEDFCGQFDFLAPGSVYGESKRCGEALCRAYYNEYNVPAKCVRIYHSYGPTLDLKNDKRAFAEFTENIVNDQDIVLKSDGNQRRAFCYMTDAIIALLTVLIKGENGESYNLANANQFISIKDLAETLVGLFPEKGLKVIYRVRKEEGYLALARTNGVPCNTEKIKRLGCKFRISVSEGFKRVINYFSGK